MPRVKRQLANILEQTAKAHFVAPRRDIKTHILLTHRHDLVYRALQTDGHQLDYSPFFCAQTALPKNPLGTGRALRFGPTPQNAQTPLVQGRHLPAVHDLYPAEQIDALDRRRAVHAHAHLWKTSRRVFFAHPMSVYLHIQQNPRPTRAITAPLSKCRPQPRATQLSSAHCRQSVAHIARCAPPRPTRPGPPHHAVRAPRNPDSIPAAQRVQYKPFGGAVRRMYLKERFNSRLVISKISRSPAHV